MFLTWRWKKALENFWTLNKARSMNPQIWVIWYVNTELLIRFSFTVKCWCQNQCEWLHRFCKFSTSTFFSHWDTLVRGSQNCSCSLDSLEIQNIVLSRSRAGTDWGTYRWWCRRPRLSLPTFQLFAKRLQCTLQISLLAEKKALQWQIQHMKRNYRDLLAKMLIPLTESHWSLARMRITGSLRITGSEGGEVGHWQGWDPAQDCVSPAPGFATLKVALVMDIVNKI